jgi:hypothetical protein
MTHESKETIRTVAAVIAVVLSSIAVAIQSYGLWFITHHPH